MPASCYKAGDNRQSSEMETMNQVAWEIILTLLRLYLLSKMMHTFIKVTDTSPVIRAGSESALTCLCDHETQHFGTYQSQTLRLKEVADGPTTPLEKRRNFFSTELRAKRAWARHAIV